MKEVRPVNLSVLIVGHRRPWNRHIRLTPRQWKLGMGIVAGVIPLLMTVGVYSMLGHVFVTHPQRVRIAAAAENRVLRSEVAVLTHDTAAGLDAMALQLGALNADASRLTALRDRLVRSAGIHFTLSHVRLHPWVQPVAVKTTPHLMSALHALSQKLGRPDPHDSPAGRAL
ncbi:MAG: hypothetical protein ACYDEV_13530 [Acidiferrobacter sp.]